MIHRALVLTSLVCCVLLLASFALFAHDQAAGASAHQQNELVSGTAVTPSAPGNRPPGQPRRFIEGAAGDLTAPFRSIVKSSSPWVDHGLPTLFGLIVYGVGLGFLARFSSGRA